MSAMSELTGVVRDIERHLRPKNTFSNNSEIFKEITDEKVLEYLKRATKVLRKFAPRIVTEWGLEVDKTTGIIEIAKMIQFEEAQS